MPEEEKKIVRQKGRGGINNFGNNAKELVKTEEQRVVARKLLGEALCAYRMPKVKSDEELAQRLDEYFQNCVNNAQVPTVEEMALYTGYTLKTLWDWQHGRTRGFSPKTSGIIEKAKEFLKTFDAKMAVAGSLNFLTYCFRAKNYYGMVDKQEVVLTPNNPLGDEPDREALEARIAATVIDEEE